MKRLFYKLLISVGLIVGLAGCEPMIGPPGTLNIDVDKDGPSFDIGDDDSFSGGIIKGQTEVLVLDPDKQYAASSFRVNTRNVGLRIYVKGTDLTNISEPVAVMVSNGSSSVGKDYTGSHYPDNQTGDYTLIRTVPATKPGLAEYHYITRYFAGTGMPELQPEDFSTGKIITEWNISIDGGSAGREYFVAVEATPIGQM